MHRRTSLISALLMVAAVAPSQEVSVRSLLPQMWDLNHLTRAPRPAYTAAQASSYDRASDPGPKQDWFANGDAGKFIRTETVGGRREYVMADVKGPGAVLRVWSANPAGVIRFYFDGETTPRLEADMAALMTGKDPRFPDPYAYMAAQGVNLYFPLPYAKSLKVTVDDTNGNRAKDLYYQVGFRTYGAGARVRTYSPTDLTRESSLIRQTATQLTKPSSGALRSGQAAFTGKVQPGQTANVIGLSGAGTVTDLQIQVPFPLIQTIQAMAWDDPHQPHNVLRSLILRVEFDGQKTIETPLGDFFGTAPGLNPYTSRPFEVLKDGTMICHLPMPYSDSMRLTIENVGKVEVPITAVARVRRGAPRDSYRLYAQWSADRGMSRPFKDMNFMTATGEGYFVGSNLHIANSTPAWWGEGDEKVYINNEPFPSTFGTGTEDYYGYAWCSPELFQRPFHAQNRCDGPGNFGHSNVNRWQTFDPIPFTQSIRFDMERWHWQNVPATFARTAFWYAKPGGRGPARVDRNLLLPPFMERPKPVVGALEGEKLAIAEHKGGKTEIQRGFWELSGDGQLWWLDPAPGDRLKFRVPVKEAGTYEVIAALGHARDYGIHRIRLNGKEVGTFDFYGEGIEWKKVSLGRHTLPAGEVILEIETVGQNAKAQPRRMFGLDYVLLEKK